MNMRYFCRVEEAGIGQLQLMPSGISQARGEQGEESKNA
jgi:hypothetical protein